MRRRLEAASTSQKIHILNLEVIKRTLCLNSRATITFSAKGRLEYNAVEHTPGQNKESMADKLRVDDVFEEWDQGANYWSGPKNTLPQGFTLELLGRVSLGNIVVRNARTTEWKSGTKAGNSKS